MDCRIKGLHFPLMVLIDFRGFRLIAMPILPIGSQTLVYGSSDGGGNIHTSNEQMNARMRLVGNILNLAPHYVWDGHNRYRSKIYGPVDIEGHLGVDQRYYVLDSARLFPPAVPVLGLKGCHLYRLLRPELVRHNNIPLCSDAYSNWNIEDKLLFNDHIAEATQKLETQIIPKVT
jgi:hypothetical protein